VAVTTASALCLTETTGYCKHNGMQRIQYQLT
jgi:hypothetical protein